MKYITILLLTLFTTSQVYAQAVGVPRSHNQLTGTGTNSHATIDTFIASKGAANGLASLDASGNLVQAVGTVTLSGGYVKQTNGTATGAVLDSVSIVSGTGTLSGVASPFIAQTNGTGTGNTLTNLKVVTSLMLGTTTSDALLEVYGGNIDFERTETAPLFNFYRNSASPSNNDSVGGVYFYGNNATPAIKEYTSIIGQIKDKTASSEIGRLLFYTMNAGSTGERMRIEGTNVLIGTTTDHTKLTVAGDLSLQSSGYINFNPGAGTATNGYGLRDNSGTMQYKNSAGTWTDIPSGATGGGWTDNGTTITENTVTDQVIIGSTTAASNQILTIVGSTTTRDMYIGGKLAIGTAGSTLTGGNSVINLALGDNDTGLKYTSDGIFNLTANNNNVVIVDGNTQRVAIGTTTSNTTLQVGGTVTALGFSGNGAGLTNLPSNFDTLTATVIKATSTANTFGTTTQHNSSVVTILGSGTSPISIKAGNTISSLGTGTTNTMTGTTTSGHTVTPSSNTSGREGWEVFDKVLDEPNRWVAQTQVATLIYDFGTGTKKVIGRYDLAVENSTNDAPTAWELAGSNDNITYTGIDYRNSYTGWAGANPDRAFNLFTIATSTTAYQFYRIKILTMQSGANATIEEMRLIEGNVSFGDALYVNGSGTTAMGTTTPVVSAALQIESISGAFLPPRMTTAQRDGLTSVNGMIIYNSTTNQFNFYENGTWTTK